MNSSTSSSVFSAITNFASTFYTVLLEPFLCICYVFLMWRIIFRSHLKELQSSFYKFFIYTGTAACLNVLVVVSKRTADAFMPNIAIKDTVFNIILFGTHWLSLTHTVGKVLVVASRFTIICCPLSQADFWTPRRVKIAGILMFAIPALLNCYVVPLDAKYRIDDKGNTIYVGVNNWAMQIIKYISNAGYFLFLVTSTPMCAISVYKLRRAQRFNNELASQERSLLIHTVVTTAAHMLKSAQQLFSLVTLITGDSVLSAVATNLYTIPNALTTFAPPILLIITSTLVRNEISRALTILPLRRFRSRTNLTTIAISRNSIDRQTHETTL